MDPDRLEYDARSKTVRYRSGVGGSGLLPRAVGLELSKIVRAGSWQGEKVSAVRVEFEDDTCAALNSDAMAYLGLLAAGPAGVVTSNARFVARSDFGIDEDG